MACRLLDVWNVSQIRPFPMSDSDPPSIQTTPISGSEPVIETPDEDQLTAIRRSFPTPRRAVPEMEESAGIDWQRLGLGALVGVAVAMAGTAAWVTLKPETPAPPPATVAVPPPAPPVSETPPPAEPPPLDDAAALYLAANPPPADSAETANPAAEPSSEDTPPPEAVPEIPASEETPAIPEMADDSTAPAVDPFEGAPPPAAVTEDQPPAPATLGPLEEKYLAALMKASSGVAAAESTAWTAEIERIKSGTPLGAPDAGQPAELQRLQSIYRREKEKAAAASTAVVAETRHPDARDIEIFTLGDDSVEILLNGQPVKTQYLAGSERTPGSVQKVPLTLKPGDVLGFLCKNSGGHRYFAMIARSGVLWHFGSNDRWDATSNPNDGWWKGEGSAEARIQILRGRTQYSTSSSAQFDTLAGTHSSRYQVIWAGSDDTCAFRYRIRKIDLPAKDTAR